MNDIAQWFLLHGTVAQWTAVFVLLGILAKQVVPMRKLSISAAEKLRDDLAKHNATLLARVSKCEEECEAHKAELRDEIRRLEDQRLGDRAQNIQEQISLVSILVKNVDNPLLSKILDQLQSAQRKLPFELTGVVGDSKSTAPQTPK